jgi:hypothetical protein
MVPVKKLVFICTLIFIFFQLNCHKQSSDLPNGHVKHIVFCWLNNTGDEIAIQKIIKASKSFEQIPGVIHVSTGGPIPSERPIVDDSFDISIIITCKDKAALQSYQKHPMHKKASKEVLQPLVSKILIYDINTIK